MDPRILLAACSFGDCGYSSGTLGSEASGIAGFCDAGTASGEMLGTSAVTEAGALTEAGGFLRAFVATAFLAALLRARVCAALRPAALCLRVAAAFLAADRRLRVLAAFCPAARRLRVAATFFPALFRLGVIFPPLQCGNKLNPKLLDYASPASSRDKICPRRISARAVAAVHF